ncbi:hypothetical protein SEA_ROOTS515_154 [Mycobacterium phage Roots515]|nr:hypothetical protein SEA_ROOTS515_154 [Mycobacterium phage Roots515]
MSPGWVLLGLGQLTVTFWGTWWLIHPNHAHERLLVFSRLTLRRNRVERPAKRKAPDMDALYAGIGIDMSSFPAPGVAGTLYIAADTGNLYRWDSVAANFELIVSAICDLPPEIIVCHIATV